MTEYRVIASGMQRKYMAPTPAEAAKRTMEYLKRYMPFAPAQLPDFLFINELFSMAPPKHYIVYIDWVKKIDQNRHVIVYEPQSGPPVEVEPLKPTPEGKPNRKVEVYDYIMMGGVASMDLWKKDYSLDEMGITLKIQRLAEGKLEFWRYPTPGELVACVRGCVDQGCFKEEKT